MKRLIVILVVVAAGALAGPAMPQWTEKTGDWSAQGLMGDSALITDPNTGTLYYLRDTVVKTYDPGTDAWTDLNPTVGAGAVGYKGPTGNADGIFYTAGGADGRFVMSYQRPRLDVYDIETNAWYKSDAPTGTYAWGWGQGNVYNTSTDTFWFFWTSPGATPPIVGAPYDPVNDTWGAAQDLGPWAGPAAYWGRMESVNIGTTNYAVRDSDCVDKTVHMATSDLTDGAFPLVTYTPTSEHDLGDGNALCWGCYAFESGFRTQVLAAHGTDIYLTGVQQSDKFLVYHTATDDWEELDPRPNDDPAQGCRNHTMAIAGDMVYVRDGGQFWVYDLGLPGLGDVDGNGVVDGLDLTAVITAWETTSSDALWNPDADLDGNDVIDGLDLTEVISNWTTTSAAPEPASLSVGAAEEGSAGPGKVKKGRGNVRRR